MYRYHTCIDTYMYTHMYRYISINTYSTVEAQQLENAAKDAEWAQKLEKAMASAQNGATATTPGQSTATEIQLRVCMSMFCIYALPIPYTAAENRMRACVCMFCVCLCMYVTLFLYMHARMKISLRATPC